MGLVYERSTLETLPDEMLLEICKYLLCTDILFAFVGLNNRMKRMITQYRHHVSLYKLSISKCDYLYVNILPQIGSQIRSILIDCCYSILQDEIFIKYFGKKMSTIFPRLERISLISYQFNQLIAFLDSLNNLNYLTEIRLYSLFPIHSDQQSTIIRSLCHANNHQLTTILIDEQSSPLHFDDTDCYLNIRRLRIKLRTSADLSFLFQAVHNIQYLDVIMDEYQGSWDNVQELNLCPLLHLTHFQLTSTKQLWTLEELFLLFAQLPLVRDLSLFLHTNDRRLIEGEAMLSSLPKNVQKFDYAIYFSDNMSDDEIEKVVGSWPSSHPVTYFYDNSFLFLHTLPWHRSHILFPTSINKRMRCKMNHKMGYDFHVEQLDLTIDSNFTSSKSLEIISQFRRMKELTINVKHNTDTFEEERFSLFIIPKLFRLTQVIIHGSIPCDLKYFSPIFYAAPNLFRLDLPFDYLWQLIENQQTNQCLGQRITSLSILKNTAMSSTVSLNESHIPIIASTFFRVHDLYVNLIHLPRNSTTAVNYHMLPDSEQQISVTTECQQHSEVVTPNSSESMLICLLREFKEHQLIGLCISGEFFEKLRSQTKQWLADNTILTEQKFEAIFSDELHRLLIWM